MSKRRTKISRAGLWVQLQARAIPCFCGLAFLAALCATPVRIGAQEKSFLWRVRSAKSSLYVLGSIHFLKKEHYPLKQAIEEAFENSKKLVLEIDLESATPANAQRLTLEKGVYRDGTNLRQNISRETYESAERRAREIGMDLKAMSPFKPWLVALSMITRKLQLLGFDAEMGVDRYFAKRAKTSGKSTGGLETLEFQLGIFDQFSRDDQELMLREALREMDLLGNNIDRMVRSWARGDVVSLQELLLASMREFPEVYQKVILERNQRWLPKLDKLLAQDDVTMVIVGAAHLVGQGGVIELLKRQGYTVEQL